MTTVRRGPTSLAERALAPDLARGFMLLFIALANSHYFLQGESVRGGFPQDVSALDSAVAWTVSTFVDGRAYPMFGVLFGYGVAQIVRRNEASGRWAVRRMLWRRSAVLVSVGLLHGLLLYVGDILAAYGVLLFLGVWTLWWRDRWLLVVAVLFLVLVSLPSQDSLAISSEPPDPSMLPSDPAAQVVTRIGVLPFIALLAPLGFACPFLVGLWAGRRRILERPHAHRPLLWATAVIGVGVAVIGAQPVSLMVSGVLPVPGAGTLAVIGPLHDTSGVLGGLGYAAAAALVADRLGARRGRIVDALVAVGQRSMTCYLAQSVVWTVAFTPFLLDLSDDLTIASTALLAVGTWLLTVALADRMRRVGYRGPLEVLIRRVTYGRPARSAVTLPPSGQAGPV